MAPTEDGTTPGVSGSMSTLPSHEKQPLQEHDSHTTKARENTNGEKERDGHAQHSSNPDSPSLKDSHNNDIEATASNAESKKSHSDTENKGKEDKKPAKKEEKPAKKEEESSDEEDPPGGFDPTPLPDCPPGYTVKFTFHKAWNLPIADLHNGEADPFLVATITAPVPRRHEEDPPLQHRTKTVRATTTPTWDEEWIVANIPSAGFKLKCRFYDEDYPDHNDRLGNVTFVTSHVDEQWEGIKRKTFKLKKRAGSTRAYLLKAATAPLRREWTITPGFELSIEVLGRSEPPGAQIYTVGPTRFIQHFSPMIGRLAGTKVHENEEDDKDKGSDSKKEDDKKSKKYDFQAIEIQLEGPVPPKLYHRYVEFRPLIGRMFSAHGLRGKLLNKTLQKQHNRIYNFDSSTEYGPLTPCSEEASMQFLKLAHFDEGGRVFTYVLTLDGLLRFTETGKEFGIDLLSKHTMHSNVATYIACSGEFFIRRLEKPTGTSDPEPDQPTHPNEPLSSGPPNNKPPSNPSYYQLIIDNDSGTYRPDKSVLPDLKKFLERNLPGLGIVTMACDDDELDELKHKQLETKKKEGTGMKMVLNRSPSSSSVSSDDESRLGDLEHEDENEGHKTKKEKVWDMLEDPKGPTNLKGVVSMGKAKLTQKSGDSAA